MLSTGPHGTLQLFRLQHAQLRSTTIPGHEAKAVDSGNSSERCIERLPATCVIGTVIYNEKRDVLTQCIDCTLCALDGCLRATRAVQGLCTKSTTPINDIDCRFSTALTNSQQILSRNGNTVPTTNQKHALTSLG